jgi:predicted GH43/DUF377 family glycosyl hydrolase
MKLQRLGTLMEPEPGNPQEVEGVLNPAAARGPDGQLYLFPRMTAAGNYSRIGIARVLFNPAGDPVGVERLGIAIEPKEDFERRADGSGGCEDPRITFVEPLKSYVMTYTALTPQGPRIALATSSDLFHWERLGLASFGPYQGIEFDHVDNKDASLFPVAIANPQGKPYLAMLHRPLFKGTRPEEKSCQSEPRELDLDRESIWISFCAMEKEALGKFTYHYRLATPVEPWERLKIGAGTPPVMTRHGWLIVYHGVSEIVEPVFGGQQLCYSAGIMLLSRKHPRIIRYRSPEPVLTPCLPEECTGTIANVVFPTGIDCRTDLGCPERFDVYYGMADRRVGVARLDLPLELIPCGSADPVEGMV